MRADQREYERAIHDGPRARGAVVESGHDVSPERRCVQCCHFERVFGTHGHHAASGDRLLRTGSETNDRNSRIVVYIILQ